MYIRASEKLAEHQLGGSYSAAIANSQLIIAGDNGKVFCLGNK